MTDDGSIQDNVMDDAIFTEKALQKKQSSHSSNEMYSQAENDPEFLTDDQIYLPKNLLSGQKGYNSYKHWL